MSAPVARLVQPSDQSGAVMLSLALLEPSAHFSDGQVVLGHVFAVASILNDLARSSGTDVEPTLQAYTQEFVNLLISAVRTMHKDNPESTNSLIYTGE